jgi:hypothetical protein
VSRRKLKPLIVVSVREGHDLAQMDLAAIWGNLIRCTLQIDRVLMWRPKVRIEEAQGEATVP